MEQIWNFHQHKNINHLHRRKFIRKCLLLNRAVLPKPHALLTSLMDCPTLDVVVSVRMYVYEERHPGFKNCRLWSTWPQCSVVVRAYHSLYGADANHLVMINFMKNGNSPPSDYDRFPELLKTYKTRTIIKASRPVQNGRHIVTNIFKSIFDLENVCVLIRISLCLVPKNPVIVM